MESNVERLQAEIDSTKQLTQVVNDSFDSESVDWESAFFELANRSIGIGQEDVAQIISTHRKKAE